MKPLDVLYLEINDILEYNPPYVQSAFTCKLGTTEIKRQQTYDTLIGRVTNYVTVTI